MNPTDLQFNPGGCQENSFVYLCTLIENHTYLDSHSIVRVLRCLFYVAIQLRAEDCVKRKLPWPYHMHVHIGHSDSTPINVFYSPFF